MSHIAVSGIICVVHAGYCVGSLCIDLFEKNPVMPADA